MAKIDFWFSIGSTYSYLTVMRLPEVAEATGAGFRWRPFNVRHVMIEQNNVPFANKPVKSAYMWRDIERRAELYGLRPTIPAPYPLPGLVLANLVATLVPKKAGKKTMFGPRIGVGSRIVCPQEKTQTFQIACWRSARTQNAFCHRRIQREPRKHWEPLPPRRWTSVYSVLPPSW